MADKPKDGGIFIFDNSVAGWTGLRYLREWSEFDACNAFLNSNVAENKGKCLRRPGRVET